jgi:hypothetical protein
VPARQIERPHERVRVEVLCRRLVASHFLHTESRAGEVPRYRRQPDAIGRVVFELIRPVPQEVIAYGDGVDTS